MLKLYFPWSTVLTQEDMWNNTPPLTHLVGLKVANYFLNKQYITIVCTGHPKVWVEVLMLFIKLKPRLLRVREWLLQHALWTATACSEAVFARQAGLFCKFTWRDHTEEQPMKEESGGNLSKSSRLLSSITPWRANVLPLSNWIIQSLVSFSATECHAVCWTFHPSIALERKISMDR